MQQEEHFVRALLARDGDGHDDLNWDLVVRRARARQRGRMSVAAALLGTLMVIGLFALRPTANRSVATVALNDVPSDPSANSSDTALPDIRLTIRVDVVPRGTTTIVAEYANDGEESLYYSGGFEVSRRANETWSPVSINVRYTRENAELLPGERTEMRIVRGVADGTSGTLVPFESGLFRICKTATTASGSSTRACDTVEVE